jgi:hypothetical protein
MREGENGGRKWREKMEGVWKVWKGWTKAYT